MPARAVFLLIASWLMLAPLATPVAAQSLAEVARAEEARRKALTGTSKVYTNEDLRGADGSRAPAAPAAPPAASQPAPAASQPAPGTAKPASAEPSGPSKEKPEDQRPEDPRKDEKHWRDRMIALQQALSRNQILADALQSRVNALKTDFVNRDDPIQRAGLEKDRQAALAEMDRVKSDIEKTKKAIADLEEEARRANVPPGWLR